VVVVVGGGLVVVVVGGGAVVVVVVGGGAVVVDAAGTWKASFRLPMAPVSGRAEAFAAVRPPPAPPGVALVSVAPVPRTRRGTTKSPRLNSEPTSRRLPPVCCALRPPPFAGDMTPAPTRDRSGNEGDTRNGRPGPQTRISQFRGEPAGSGNPDRERSRRGVGRRGGDDRRRQPLQLGDERADERHVARLIALAAVGHRGKEWACLLYTSRCV